MLPAWRGNLFVVLLTLLAGCAGEVVRAPVEERSPTPSRRIERHVVSPGETLFSIAWSYGIDFRQLASTNGIGPPYTIRPGQQLRLPWASSARPGGVVAASGKSPSAGSAPGTGVTGKDGGTTGSARGTTERPSRAAANPLPAGPWQWPARGRVVAGFRPTSPVHKGIDIRGELGEPVYAANDGKVVYAGSGLVGYGNLLIVKHSDRYLSAYAHNNRLLVGEGAQVKAGDRIAEIGDSGTDSAKLHFEIRCDGEPVDPLRMLPKR